MTNSPQAKKSSPNTNHDHEGFVFRLIPTPQQEALFEEMTRAAHWGSTHSPKPGRSTTKTTGQEKISSWLA